MLKGVFSNWRSPLVWYFVSLLLVGVCETIHVGRGFTAGPHALAVQAYVLAYFIALWMWRDSRERWLGFPADFGLLAQAIFLPIYLIKTRGWRGLGLLILILSAPMLAAWMPLIVFGPNDL